MNISIISLVISRAALSLHSPLISRSLSSQLFEYKLSQCIFSYQLSPIFEAFGLRSSISVIDSDFGFFLDTAIQIGTSWGGYIDVDRNAEFDYGQIVTCPLAKLIRSKFHDFTSARLTGAAFGAGHDTAVNIEDCQFFKITTTGENSRGMAYADVSKEVTMVRTSFSECTNVYQTNQGFEHSFCFISEQAIKIEEVTIYKCGWEKTGLTSHVEPKSGFNLTRFNVSDVKYNFGSDTGIKIVFTSKKIYLRFLTFVNHENDGGNGVMTLEPTGSGQFLPSIDFANFLNIHDSNFIKFQLTKASSKMMIKSTTQNDIQIQIHNSAFIGVKDLVPMEIFFCIYLDACKADFKNVVMNENCLLGTKVTLIGESIKIVDSANIKTINFDGTTQTNGQNNNPPGDGDKNPLGVGAIAGIVVGCIVVVGGIVGAAVYFVKFKPKQRVEQNSAADATTNATP